MHFKIVNNTDIDLPLNYEFVTHGMKIPTSAVTTSDNLSLTDLDIYPGDGVDGATTIFILPKKDISPNEVCEIWIDLSQCKLYDKTLYEDFSKKVDLSNGLPTNSTLDKDKNGPYMIDISFYSPILDIIYLYSCLLIINYHKNFVILLSYLFFVLSAKLAILFLYNLPLIYHLNVSQ